METVSQVPGLSPHDSDALRQGGGMLQQGAEPTGLLMERAGDEECLWGKVCLLPGEGS